MDGSKVIMISRIMLRAGRLAVIAAGCNDQRDTSIRAICFLRPLTSSGARPSTSSVLDGCISCEYRREGQGRERWSKTLHKVDALSSHVIGERILTRSRRRMP
jgi:hypothetical protein